MFPLPAGALGFSSPSSHPGARAACALGAIAAHRLASSQIQTLIGLWLKARPAQGQARGLRGVSRGQLALSTARRARGGSLPEVWRCRMPYYSKGASTAGVNLGGQGGRCSASLHAPDEAGGRRAGGGGAHQHMGWEARLLPRLVTLWHSPFWTHSSTAARGWRWRRAPKRESACPPCTSVPTALCGWLLEMDR